MEEVVAMVDSGIAIYTKTCDAPNWHGEQELIVLVQMESMHLV